MTELDKTKLCGNCEGLRETEERVFVCGKPSISLKKKELGKNVSTERALWLANNSREYELRLCNVKKCSFW